MKRRIFQLRALIFLLAYFQSHYFVVGQEKTANPDLYSRLKAVKGVFVKKIEALPGFKEGYEIAVVQPVDHANPNGPTFTQRMFLSHRDYKKPVVLETEGYGATWPKERELAKILEANQIIVEHRYYESSKPKPLKWEYLTSWQAASDHHRIVEFLKNIYPGKWVSCGRSKGGMAALFHRAYYPADVDATVAYVAPIMIGPIDPRFEIFMNSIGDESSREKIRQFQRTCLVRKSELLPLLKKFTDKQKLTFPCTLDEALEWTVIEFPYSFWSGNNKVNELPQPGVAKERLFAYLHKVNSFSSVSKAKINFNAALYYQQYTEIGYHGYPVSHLADLLKAVKNPDFSFHVPKDVHHAIFNNEAMSAILDFLQNKGNNIIYLYGEYDVWTSCAVELTGKTNALKLVIKEKGHLFDIKDLSVAEKNKIYTTLEGWLQVKIKKNDEKETKQ